MSTFQHQRLVSQAKRAAAAGRYAEAQQLCEQAVKRDKRNVEAIELMGLLAMQQGVMDEAQRLFRKCVTLRPRESRYHYRLGQVLHDQGRCREALAKFDQALAADPDSPMILLSKAAALERLGEVDAAGRTLEPIATAAAANASAAGLWARILMRAGKVDDAIDFLRGRLAEFEGPPRARQALLFVLGRALDAAGEYDDAFSACREANEIDKPDFDAGKYVAFVDEMIRVFSEPLRETLPRSRQTSDNLIFVAGMPRSGTTLVEQIIDAHPQAHGLGELIHCSQLVADLQMQLGSYEPFPGCLEDMTAEQCDRFARTYLNHVRSLHRAATRLVDKTLDNFELLGFLSLLLPKGRAVICRRDPRDTCLSCYLNHIVPQRYPFVADLRSLGLVYRQHERLLEHWAEALDIAQHTVEYEQMVSEPRTHIRALVDFSGLPWSDQCLRFFESGRPVMTLSYDQVSQPIYDRSVGRWKHYEKHLGPLLEALQS